MNNANEARSSAGLPELVTVQIGDEPKSPNPLAMYEVTRIVRRNVLEGGASLRYGLFDMGKLFLKNDADGSRNRKWRDLVDDILSEHVTDVLPWRSAKLSDGLIECPSPDTIAAVCYVLREVFGRIDGNISDLLTAIFGDEQLSFIRKVYTQLINRIQERIAIDLNYIAHYWSVGPDSPEIVNRYSESGVAFGDLSWVSWDSYCGEFERPLGQQYFYKVTSGEPMIGECRPAGLVMDVPLSAVVK